MRAECSVERRFSISVGQGATRVLVFTDEGDRIVAAMSFQNGDIFLDKEVVSIDYSALVSRARYTFNRNEATR